MSGHIRRNQANTGNHHEQNTRRWYTRAATLLGALSVGTAVFAGTANAAPQLQPTAMYVEQSAPACEKVAPGSKLSSGYGYRGKEFHNGIDCAAPVGTAVITPESGTVIDDGPAQGYGQWVVVNYDSGRRAEFGHISSDTVEVGQRVNAGDQIATVGNEGMSTGPHLHYRDSGGNPVNVLAGVAVIPPEMSNPAPTPEESAPATPFSDSIQIEVQKVVPGFTLPEEFRRFEQSLVPPPR